jgi:hypothetical protein
MTGDNRGSQRLAFIVYAVSECARFAEGRLYLLSLICLLNELYAQAKSGAQPERDCNCQSLHAMAGGR